MFHFCSTSTDVITIPDMFFEKRLKLLIKVLVGVYVTLYQRHDYAWKDIVKYFKSYHLVK